MNSLPNITLKLPCLRRVMFRNCCFQANGSTSRLVSLPTVSRASWQRKQPYDTEYAFDGCLRNGFAHFRRSDLNARAQMSHDPATSLNAARLLSSLFCRTVRILLVVLAGLLGFWRSCLRFGGYFFGLRRSFLWCWWQLFG